MNLGLFSERSSWQPAWRFDAGGVLWRLLPDNRGSILGEVRDPESRTAWFFCLREQDGAARWDRLRLHESWWLGVDDVVDGRVFFHGFRKPDMPQHLGIFVHDLISGNELWRNEELTWLLTWEGMVYAAREGFDGLRLLRLDAATGAVIDEPGADHRALRSAREQANAENRFAGYAWPEPFTEEHAQHAVCAGAVAELLRESDAHGHPDVLLHDDVLFCAWHARKAGGGLEQHFAARRLDNGRTLFRTRLLAHADAPGMDSFFIKDNLLLYIQDRRVLTVHDLHGVPA